MAEQLNTYAPQDTTPEGHNEAMIAKADALEKSSERPEWLPEKFKSPEDMARSYTELEKKLSQPKEEVEEEEQEEAKEAAPDKEVTEVAEVLDKAGLNFDEFQNEYADTGALTPESYKKLEKAGFPKGVVDAWVEGQQAVANQMTQSVYAEVGGEDSYRDMVGWAADNMSPSEINAFNSNIDSGNQDLVKFAVKGLQARYRSEVGQEPKLVQGQAAPTTSGSFNSSAELTAAMRDPRYAKDPAYRKLVSDRLAKSNVF